MSVPQIRKFKIKGVMSEREFNGLPFGRQIETLRAFEAFKTQPGVKSTHLSQKRRKYGPVIKEAIKLLDVAEYYCCFHADPNYYDDSFEFWYRKKSPMTLQRIGELRRELKAERISYGELAEIDSAAVEAGIVVTDEMFADNILDELEQKVS